MLIALKILEIVKDGCSDVKDAINLIKNISMQRNKKKQERTNKDERATMVTIAR